MDRLTIARTIFAGILMPHADQPGKSCWSRIIEYLRHVYLDAEPALHVTDQGHCIERVYSKGIE